MFLTTNSTSHITLTCFETRQCTHGNNLHLAHIAVKNNYSNYKNKTFQEKDKRDRHNQRVDSKQALMGAATGKARHAGFEPVGDVSMQDVCRGPRRLEHKNPFVGVSNTELVFCDN